MSNDKSNCLKEDVQIYIFSFNRGVFLENCLKSVEYCADGFDTTIIDDQSYDLFTRDVLQKNKNKFEIITVGTSDIVEHKTGGLYNNMRYAFSDAQQRGKKYVLFLQDDMQLVRPITDEDIVAACRFFEVNENSAELHTCFMKRYFASIDEEYTVLDSSRVAYLRPSHYPGFSGFSAVGFFDIARFVKLYGELRQGEYMNNEYAQSKNLQMGISIRPFMMWLPYPISHRGKKRNIPLQIVESIGGCGYFPYDMMKEQDIQRLLSRDPEIKPYAEDWLKADSLNSVKVWSFAGGLSNLYARGGIRYRLGKILSRMRET